MWRAWWRRWWTMVRGWQCAGIGNVLVSVMCWFKQCASPCACTSNSQSSPSNCLLSPMCLHPCCCSSLPPAPAVQDALSVLRTGIALRQAAATAYNAASSRSHCIFTCHVESRLEPQPGLVNVRSSRLHMVDLAGSERLRYGEGGMGLGDGSDQLLKETTAINSSLSVLGLVILKLTESQAHIPYRNSKLTFLLQVG